MLPFDLAEMLHQELQRGRRPNDGLLHASSHIASPLRHVQLDVAGAPKTQSGLLSEITLMTGTLWHEYLHDMLRRLGVPYMAEVNLNPWLPPGWGGTADAVVWNPDLKAFVLVDFKTQKGEGMRFITRDGAKTEHRAQVSAYWHALKKMGIPLAKKTAVWYLPKNDTRGKDDVIEPILADFDPLPVRALHALMKERADRVDEYRVSLQGSKKKPTTNAYWLTEALAPVAEREQKVYFSRPTGTWEVKLVPHWTSAYCPFPEELCDCSTYGTTKVGWYDLDGVYYARSGFEEVAVTVAPPE